MKKQTIVYCYRMTHDYGINPCVFTENYDKTLRRTGLIKLIIMKWMHT